MNGCERMTEYTVYSEDYVPEPLTIAVSFGDEQLDEMANHATTEETAQAFADELKRREASGEIMNAVAMEALTFAGENYKIAAMFGFLTMLNENWDFRTTTYASLAERIAEYVQTIESLEYIPYTGSKYDLVRMSLAETLDAICEVNRLNVNEQIDYVLNYPRAKNLSCGDVVYQLVWELRNS